MHVYVYIIFIYQNVKNGLTEQDWDIPRNIDIIGNHFRNDLFDFRKAVTCKCKPQDSPSGTNSQKFFLGLFFFDNLFIWTSGTHSPCSGCLVLDLH